MKKLLMVSAMVLIMAMVVAGCTQKVEQIPDQTTPAADVMENKDESMEKEDTMEKEEPMEKQESMDKEEAMDSDKMMDEKEDSMEEKQTMEDTMMKNEGKEAPDFTLTSINGETYALSELTGEKVYLKFWASWCPICVSGLGELDQLSAENTDFRVLTVIAPNKNGEKSLEDFKAWFEKQGTENVEVLVDETGDLFRDYGVRGFPTSAYIGSDGVLIKTVPGHNANDVVKGTFEKIY